MREVSVVPVSRIRPLLGGGINVSVLVVPISNVRPLLNGGLTASVEAGLRYGFANPSLGGSIELKVAEVKPKVPSVMSYLPSMLLGKVTAPNVIISENFTIPLNIDNPIANVGSGNPANTEEPDTPTVSFV